MITEQHRRRTLRTIRDELWHDMRIVEAMCSRSAFFVLHKAELLLRQAVVVIGTRHTLALAFLSHTVALCM